MKIGVNCIHRKAIVDHLLEKILGSDVCESSIVHGITVLLTILEIRRPPLVFIGFLIIFCWDSILCFSLLKANDIK